MSAAYEPTPMPGGEPPLGPVDLSGVRRLRRGFLTDRERGNEEIESAMIDEFERVLDHPPHTRLAKGGILVRQGETLDCIYIRLAGRVSLNRRVNGVDVVFHSETAGPVIGLMSLSEGHSALYTCRAETDIEVIRVSFDELDAALQRSPDLTIHFTTVLLRWLARRNRRALELRIEVQTLNRELARERDQLTATVDQLQKAHLRLVQSEKMATLGQLVAGLAHELNNPVSAIVRAAEFASLDLEQLVGALGQADVHLRFLRRGGRVQPMSSRETRACREALTREIGDARLADRLARVGIGSMTEARAAMEGLGAASVADALPEMEVSYRLGRSLQNIRNCAERISGLVTSLRSYGRAGSERRSDVDVHEGIEETLSLFGHALREVEVQRDYGDLPPIEAIPGELNQVWTNLIANAVQAMDGHGELRLETRRGLDGGTIDVAIVDNGPGIAPAHLERIFELNFTTKQGRVDYGIGLGLPICREIVERHGGRIEVASRPGRTCFTVRLPVRQTDDRNVAAADETGERDGGGE